MTARDNRITGNDVVWERKKSLATTYSPTLKGQYHRRGRA